MDSDFWHAVKSGVEAAATEYNVSVTFEGPENEEDFEAQNRMIADAVQNGADVIVLSAIDYDKNAAAVNAAVMRAVVNGLARSVVFIAFVGIKERPVHTGIKGFHQLFIIGFYFDS